MKFSFDVKRFLRDLKPHQSGLWIAFACSVVSAAIEPIIPALMAKLLDHSVASSVAPDVQYPAWAVPLIIVGVFSLRAFVNYASSYVMTRSTQSMVEDIRNRLFGRILYSDPSLFERQPASMLINTISLETMNAVNSLVNSVQTFVKEGLSLVALVGFLFWLNWQLTLVAMCVLPVVAVIVRFTRDRLFAIMRASQVGMDQMTYAVEENVLAYRVVRLYGTQRSQDGRFHKVNHFLRNAAIKMNAAGALVTPLTQVATSVAVAVIVTMALRQSSDGNLTVGGFAAYITTMLMTVPRAKSLSDVWPGIQRGAIALQRIYALMDEKQEEDKGTHTAERARGEIRFEHVSKRYPNTDRPAVDDLSLEIRAGETVAFVGHSGSGKTTLVNMLPRFLEPTEGVIRLDGVPLGDWTLDSLRAQMSMVNQDVVLFNDTVAANVALVQEGDGIEVDMERVRHALRMAHLLHFVEGLPDGLDTRMGHNGQTFSGGQRQRMAIARALYRDTPVLILDEATSALDAESERLVQDALRNLTTGRTTIVVAHRLSTIQHADRIVVMDQGHIIEMGNYAELMARDGAFARLVAAQMAMDVQPEVVATTAA
ncbi:lipid A export permease/ATP-binding protein MsbA [Corticibacter populi]|uniref:lipid A export permease/ATP-binding protein MsbA n=1 Tax=Corticibacter populi TaxID=1550736 RepID=UPI0010D7FB5F|nr:lipid A export permease/ATP-binding protein MsbA [Corticibacter populi]RZS33202.1 subfamily B ATP-binding cassette protein MsbA [Corticibacter populi]